MPTISMFYGIVIQMFWQEHPPPHEALINIQTLEIIKGFLPKRAMVMVLEWANEHRGELMEAWNQCVHMQPPQKIEPLS